MISETLAVLITGDSSSLQTELSRAADGVARLQDQLSRIGGAVTQAAGSFASFARATSALQSVSQAAQQVQQALQALSQTSVTLNVAPALGALASLSAAIAGVMAQLAALAAAMGGLGGGGPRVSVAPRAYAAGGAVGPGMSVPMLAAGGAIAAAGRWFLPAGGEVTGPGGVDRVPAFLTAGEFVLRTAAVDAVGLPLLEALNRDPAEVVLGTTAIGRAGGGGSAVMEDAGRGGESQVVLSAPVLAATSTMVRGGALAAEPGVLSMTTLEDASRQSSQTQTFGDVHVHVQTATTWDDLRRVIENEAVALRTRRG